MQRARKSAAVPGHHAASLVLVLDSNPIFLPPASRCSSQSIDSSMGWNVSVRNWRVFDFDRDFGRLGLLVLVGRLLRSLDFRKDGHAESNDCLG